MILEEISNKFIFFYTLGLGKDLSGPQLICVPQSAGITNPTYARTTRKLVFAVLETAVNFCMIAVITSMDGSWSVNGKKETTVSKIHMLMK